MDGDEEPNSLAALINVARTLVRQFEEQEGVALPPGAMIWPFSHDEEPFPTTADGAPVYPTRELGGVAGLYHWIKDNDLGEVAFANDLSWEVRGIDAVYRDRRTGRFVLCEAKGTAHPIAGGPLSYLRRTRGKGRQLSWEWCWATLVDFACVGSTAPAFLNLLAPFLAGEVDRLLVVTELRPENGGWRIVGSKAWREDDFSSIPELAEAYDLGRQRDWLGEILTSSDSISGSEKFTSEDPETGRALGVYNVSNKLETTDWKGNFRIQLSQDTENHFDFLSIHQKIIQTPPRFLRSQVVSIDSDRPREVVEYFRPGVEHLLFIWIGPLVADETADGPAFPEEKLQPGPQGSELTVVLVEPNQLEKPLMGKLLLPKEGRSDICDFALPALKPGAFRGTIIVLHRNRVIQTASLSGSVAPQNSVSESLIKFKIDAVIRQDLADVEFRDPFDAAIIIGADNTRTMVDGDRACVREMAEVTAAAARIRETLDAATRQSEPNLDDMLFTCAHQGILLRKAVLDGAPPSLAQAQSIQLVAAKPEAYLPLEFCYDGRAPKGGAKVCRDVGDGCSTACANAGTASVICPLAFWGLSRVIERHAYNAREKIETGWVLRQETSAVNKGFGGLSAALVGASAKAEDHDGVIKLADVITVLNTAGIRAVQVKNWSEWQEQVEGLPQNGASLLLVIGHTEVDARAGVGVLEIGGDALMRSELDRGFIGKGNALAVILGCSTAGNVEGVNNFATDFRRDGAAVVIGTTTAVLGRHATPLAKALVERLAQRAGGSTSIRLGALMRDLRLHFLSKGIPIGLATVAFGDADWTFGGAETRQ